VFLAPDVPDQGLLLQMVGSVIDGGRGLRPLFPTLDSAVFVPRWRPEHRGYEIVPAEPRGRVDPLGSGPDALGRAAGLFIGNGWKAEAQALLDSARAAYPADSGLAQLARAMVAR